MGIQIALLFAVCLIIIYYDLLFRRVPNWALLGTIGIQVVWLVVAATGSSEIDVGQFLIGGIAGLVLFLPLYGLRVMGAGDVKFFAVLGLLLGTRPLLPIWLIASLLAGVHALAWYVSERQMMVMPSAWMQFKERMTAHPLYQHMMKKREGRHGIPYAAYLAIAAIAVNSH